MFMILGKYFETTSLSQFWQLSQFLEGQFVKKIGSSGNLSNVFDTYTWAHKKIPSISIISYVNHF